MPVLISSNGWRRPSNPFHRRRRIRIGHLSQRRRWRFQPTFFRRRCRCGRRVSSSSELSNKVLVEIVGHLSRQILKHIVAFEASFAARKEPLGLSEQLLFDVVALSQV